MGSECKKINSVFKYVSYNFHLTSAIIQASTPLPKIIHMPYCLGLFIILWHFIGHINVTPSDYKKEKASNSQCSHMKE